MLYDPLLNWTTQQQCSNNSTSTQQQQITKTTQACPTTRMRVPRHSARAWRSSRLRIWKKCDSFSRYIFWRPMLASFLVVGGRRRLLSLRGERCDWDCPEWLPIWTKEAPLIEPRWAGVGRLPRPSGAPPSEPRLLAFTGVIHTLVSTLLLSLQLSPSVDVTHTDTRTHTQSHTRKHTTSTVPSLSYLCDSFIIDTSLILTLSMSACVLLCCSCINLLKII